MKSKLLRIGVFFLTMALLLNGLPVAIPTLSADTVKTPVLPLEPLNASGMGGAKVEVKKNYKLFMETESVEITADSELMGIIAEAPEKDTSVSPVMKITPMLTGSAVTYNYATVSHLFKQTTNLTEEKGIQITSAIGEYSVSETNGSQAYINIAYDKRNSFVDADGVMFYLKTDGANRIAPNFAAFAPETAGRWKYDFDPVLMLMAGKEYSYKTLDATSWTMATAVNDKSGSSYFGAIEFDSAFEGYIKIPLDSLGNDLGFQFKPYQDSFKQMCVKMIGVGGKYGTVTAGPYFVVNKDSTSTEMEVDNASFSAAPANVGGKITGFKQPLRDTDAILLYVKTSAPNRISLAANMWDDYLSDIPSLILKEKATVYAATLGTDQWIEKTTLETDAYGAVAFKEAFEGYLKVPISSLKEQEASPFIAIYPEIDYITGIEVTSGGVGGKYGTIEVVPFLINEDKETTSFELSAEYIPPVAEATEVVPLMDTQIQPNNWQYVTHTQIKPLDYTNAVGTMMTAKDAAGYIAPNMNGSQAYANFKVNDYPLIGYEGIVFYVKLEHANLVCPQIALNPPTETGRWKYSWDPIMLLKVGGYYEYMSIDGTEWQVGSAVAGVSGNAYFGSAQFDDAFEGYIKIPYSSLANDSGFVMSAKVDTIKSIVYRAKGVGGAYGTVSFGPTLFISKDGEAGIQLKTAEPTIVKPITEWESNQTAPKSSQTVVTPLDWTDAKGLRFVANESYMNDYPATGLAYARFKTTTDFVLGNATHIIFYIKTDSANTVLPRIVYSSSALNMSYEPEMTLGVGKTYSYLPIGGSKWISATAVPTWKNGSNVSSTYFGGMKFDKAFEGYIKIPIADLSNDYAKVNNAPRATTAISNFIVSASRVGGEYGAVTAGPIFLTENDTDSPVLMLYAEPSEFEGVAVNAEPLSGTVTANGIQVETVAPFRGLTLDGYRLTANTPWAVENDKISGNANVFSMTADTALMDSYGFLLYIKTDKDIVTSPTVILEKPSDTKRWHGSGMPELSLGVEKRYELLSFEDAAWIKKSAIRASGSDTAHGGITLPSGFEGYIRIPFESLVSDNGFEVSSDLDTLYTVEFRFNQLGEEEQSITLGPISLIKNKGESTEIVYPASFDSDDPYERIQGIFERSKRGLVQGHYYMVGDSTRHLYGYPIFRIVRDALKNNYRMDCTVQALSGLKAEQWSGYTPGLDGPHYPTVDQLIEQIPGNGRNCIVDIALGINDAAKGGEAVYEFLKMGIDKIKEAKPETVIVYTTPNLVSSAKWNQSIYDAAEKIWEDKSIYKIDPMKNVLADYYVQYYTDTVHPNSLGYKVIGQYIVSCYVEGLSFEKIVEFDSAEYTLPEDCEPIQSTLIVDNIFNATAGNYGMTVNGIAVGSLKVVGSTEATGKEPFSTANFVQIQLSEPLNGNDYIAFYLRLPAANRIGLRAFTLRNNSEIIFKRDMNYYVMQLGTEEWVEKMTGSGRADDIDTYGSLDFDDAFEGWVKLPLSGFYGSPSASEDINGITFRFSELGGSYGEVRVGAFFSTSDKPYMASNVWDSADLPEMVPLTPITELDSAPWMFKDFVPSPIPSLTSNRAMVIASDPPGEYEGARYVNSIHWTSTRYEEMSLGHFTHLIFYVKSCESRENHLAIQMTTSKGTFQIMAQMDYQLLPLGETKWQHYNAERTINSVGGFTLPKGFEGFIKLPSASMLPSNRLTEDTIIEKIFYRWSYVGTGKDRIIAGPVFGVIKDNDTGPDEVVYSSLPDATTVKSIFAIDEEDTFVDTVMLYWEAFEGAKYYVAEAYHVTRTDNGLEYRLETSNRCVPNSGCITDLMPGETYAVMIKAYDLLDKMLAIYDYTLVTTPDTDEYDVALPSNNMEFDKVYYPEKKRVEKTSDSAAENDSNKNKSKQYSKKVIKRLVTITEPFPWVPVIIGGAGALLVASATSFIIVFAKKRRKKNA